MLSELVRAPQVGIRVRLYYGADTTATNLAYDSEQGSTGGPFKSSYREDHTMYVFGATWAVTVEASPESGDGRYRSIRMPTVIKLPARSSPCSSSPPR